MTIETTIRPDRSAVVRPGGPSRPGPRGPGPLSPRREPRRPSRRRDHRRRSTAGPVSSTTRASSTSRSPGRLAEIDVDGRPGRAGLAGRPVDPPGLRVVPRRQRAAAGRHRVPGDLRPRTTCTWPSSPTTRDPAPIRAHLMDRDNVRLFVQNDHVGFQVDPFNDQRRAFQFRINPLGVQVDAVFSEIDQVEDFSWDAIWSSRGRITADGYVVEVAVPLEQLRFPRAEATRPGASRRSATSRGAPATGSPRSSPTATRTAPSARRTRSPASPASARA